jgi:hypothetical protein
VVSKVLLLCLYMKNDGYPGMLVVLAKTPSVYGIVQETVANLCARRPSASCFGGLLSRSVGRAGWRYLLNSAIATAAC